MKKIEELDNFRHLSEVEKSKVDDAEKELLVKFAKDYKDVILNYGIISCNGHELTGICDSKRLNVVDVTKAERNYNFEANNLYVIEKTNVDNNVIWQSNNGTIYQTVGSSKPIKIYDSLIEYLEH